MENDHHDGAARSLAHEPAAARQHRRVAGGALSLALGAALLAPCFASCSFITPEVGNFRGSCKGGSGGYAGYAGYDAGAPGDPDPRCIPAETDDACAICEDTHCCGTRFGCYDDEACSCADQEFDECLQEIVDPQSEDGTAATAHCWEEFTGTNARAKARVDCQRGFCKEECGVP